MRRVFLATMLCAAALPVHPQLRPNGNQIWHQDSGTVGGTAEADDGFGEALAMGDFDGDGFVDLAVGVPFEDVGDVQDAGLVNILYGRSGGLTSTGNQTLFQGQPGIGETPEPGDHFGAVVTVGNFNGDAYADLAIGVPDEDIAGAFNAGLVTIVYGSASGLTGTGARTFTQDEFGDDVANADGFGFALASGDFDSDGFDDLAAAAPEEDFAATDDGLIHVIFGSAGGLESAGFVLLSHDRTNTIGGAMSGDLFGSALAVGDFDGNGFDDLAIGEIGADIGPGMEGVVNIAYGGPSSGPRSLAQGLFGIEGFAVPSDEWGHALAAGDFDRDGFADLAVGAPGEPVEGAPMAGMVQVFYGSSAGLNHRDEVWHAAVPGVLGEARIGNRFGNALAVGDFDRDRMDDLAVTVQFDDIQGGTVDAGSVLVLRGGASGLTARDDQVWTQDSQGILGTAAGNEFFGASLAAGDITRNGAADLAIGVPLDDLDVGNPAGAVNLLFGLPSSASETFLRTGFETTEKFVFRDCESCPVMTVIPAGSFLMGDLEGDLAATQQPVHSVAVPAFVAGIHEVTWNQWESCVEDGFCNGSVSSGSWGRATRPVSGLNWLATQHFVAWLTRESGHRYRLLSGAEWEYATRAGTTTRFWWGNQDPSLCNADAIDGASDLTCPDDGPHPVATYFPNPFGLFDVHSNVWEYVTDCWQPNYLDAPVDGSARLDDQCTQATLRGGSFDNGGSNRRSSFRAFADRAIPLNTLPFGFRVARDLGSADRQGTLLSWWPLDGNALAFPGLGVDGTLVGGVIPTQDRNGFPGGALRFSGAPSQFVSVPGGGGLNGATEATIGIWVRWSGVQDDDCCGTYGAILSRQSNGVFSENVIALDGPDPATARVSWRQTNAATPGLELTSNTSPGSAWRHIAITFGPAGTALYIDGVLESTGVGGPLSDDPGVALSIGAWSGDGSGYASADIGELAIWRVQLTPTQIEELAGGASPFAFDFPFP